VIDGWVFHSERAIPRALDVMTSPQHSAEHIVVVNPQHRVTTAADSVTRLRDSLVSSIEQGRKSILLDLGQVSYMDSMLLGELVHAYATAVRRGATLKLVNVTSRLRELLRITKLDRVLHSTDNDQS
jgi:anti-sigma B factor antagonist